MKVYKKDNLSLLVKIFGLKGDLYLSPTILVYFDLNDPDHPLKEQELWQVIPEQLGEQVLDMGWPKPRGEVLITGKCFAPRGTSRPASTVSFRVGTLTKTLDVFGDRNWETVNVNDHDRYGAPTPFTEMPISWDRAFGGEGYDLNPAGKGFKPVMLPDGSEIHPLPNIELPGRLVASQDDTPPPAGFGPIDLMLPPRAQKTGTYGEQWLAERWPFFPDDLNPEFFNTAPEDQMLEEYFQGHETIEIQNMHPDLQAISSRLPDVRVRCFITQKKDPKAEPEDDLFKEVKTRIDTLWLFPEIMRGVAMYRGTLKVQDDEFADIRRIFLAYEKGDQEPLSIEHYYEEQEKAADLSVPIDPAPIEAAVKKVKMAQKKIRAIPKEVDRIKKQAMGKAPRMQRSLTEIHEISKGVIADRLADMDKLEDMSRSLHSQFGHMVKIKLDVFDKTRAKLREMGKKLDQTAARLAEKQSEMDAVPQEMKEQVSDSLKELIPPDQLELTGLDPDDLDLDIIKKGKPWHDQGFSFVVQCRKNLEKDQDARDRLAKLGFDPGTIKRAWLGINPEEISEEPEPWGLKPENQKIGRSGQLVLPPGLVIPRFEDAELKRIIIRQGEYNTDQNDLPVEGSDEIPLALLIDKGAPIVIAGDDLTAWRVEEEIGDLCSIVSMKDPGVSPDDLTAEALEAAPAVLVILPASKAHPESAFNPWLEAFPNARKLVVPDAETVFEAHEKGEDIRQWILKNLPEDMARPHLDEPEEIASVEKPGQFKMPDLKLSAVGIQALVDGAIKEVQDSFEPFKEEMLAKEKEIHEAAKKAVTKSGHDFDALMDAAKKEPTPSFAQATDDTLKQMAENRKSLKAKGMLPPQAEAKMKEAEKKVRELGREAESRWQEGQAKLAEGREKVAAAKAKVQSGALPASAKEKFMAMGIDIDRRIKLTREQVIELHQKGESLSSAILSEVDLSGLDLSGIDLSHAELKKTDFSQSNLEGANFTEAIGMEAIFNECSLKGAVFQKGLFTQASFQKADLQKADFQQALLKKADLSEANLTGARINLSILSGAKLKKAVFSKAELSLSILSEADATETDFTEADLRQCMFKNAVLNKTDFSRAVVNMTSFYGAVGKNTLFIGANMDKSRMGGNASFPGADFRNASMVEACYRDSDLRQAAFDGAVLHQAILENCDLSGAGFTRTIAKKSRLIKSNLEGASMKFINLFQGSLRKSRLVNADLRASNLYGVDFHKAVFGNTQMEMANLKATQLYERADLLK